MIFKTKASKDSDRRITIDKNFDLMDVTPEQLAEAATKTWAIDMQAQIRRLMDEGKSDKEIELFCEEWTPAFKAPRTVKILTAENMLEAFAKLSPEEQQKVLSGMAIPK